MTGGVKWSITLLMGLTLFRAQTVLFLPTVEMYGGIAPDAWFAPWLSDAILGFLLPLMLWLFWTKRGVRVWGVLVLYNAVGTFDYATGLATQWIHPMPAEMASATTAYVGIGLFMVFQLVALTLLFRGDVVDHFSGVR
ncbi:MAG: hypothetical protein WBA51_15920 [Erythrobacter sp.]